MTEKSGFKEHDKLEKYYRLAEEIRKDWSEAIVGISVASSLR